MLKNTQHYLRLAIVIIYIAGLFLPYSMEMEFDLPVTYYGWESPVYLLLLAISMIIVGFSFLSYIAWRLLIMRIALVLYVPAIIIVLLSDASYMSGGPYASEPKVAVLLNYIGSLLAIIFGIIHFSSSYRVYKQLLQQELKAESDLLDL